ncbi:hypothetical protein RHOSPDRAFT_27211 [Rhodotorula sp. JG-1b]|nr:hypothetical protein RHOSPDRAFT_27211 [Rhodotorula sp. JG-1b]
MLLAILCLQQLPPAPAPMIVQRSSLHRRPGVVVKKRNGNFQGNGGVAAVCSLPAVILPALIGFDGVINPASCLWLVLPQDLASVTVGCPDSRSTRTHRFVQHSFCCCAKLLNIQGKFADLFSQVTHIFQFPCTGPFHPGDAVSAKALKELCLDLLPRLIRMAPTAGRPCPGKIIRNPAPQWQDIVQASEHILWGFLSLRWH